MASTYFNQQEGKWSFWKDGLLYVNAALLVFIVFCSVALIYQINFQKNENERLKDELSSYGTSEQKSLEQQFLDYRMRIDDFAKIISLRKISYGIFSIIEQHALPDIWFSGFDIFLPENRFEIAGEAENMGVLSRQIRVFEESEDNITNITVLNSQVAEAGRIRFVLSVSLDPIIFSYQNSLLSIQTPVN